MKKNLLFLAALCLGATASGQGYWASMAAGAPGDFPNVTTVINALLYHNNTIYQAGRLAETFVPNDNSVYAFDGTGYRVGTGAGELNEDGLIWSMCTDGQNNIYVAGAMDGNNPGFDVIKWNGSVWAVLGAESPLAANNQIMTLCSDAANNIYAAGRFKNVSTANANAKYYVAKWDGSAWSELGGVNALSAGGFIQSITTDAANLYAAGFFTNASGNRYVAKWNGNAWSELGGLNALAANDVIERLYIDAVGNLYAAGRFTNTSGNRYVAKWDGSAWSELGIGVNALNANGTINAITSDAAGNIYAAGWFTNASGVHYVAKWDGTAWTELGAGPYALNANSPILTLCVDAQARIYAGGNFSDGNGMIYVARYTDNFNVDSVQIKVLNNLPPQITTNGGTLQMSSRVFPVMGNQSVTWSISPTSLATISTTGKITALANGEVWPKATSVENPALSDSMMVTISGQETSGMEEVSKANGIRIFPNPANEELFIELAPEYKQGLFTIYDSKGAAVLTQKNKGSRTSINIHSLSQGVYTLQFVSDMHRGYITFTKRK